MEFIKKVITTAIVVAGLISATTKTYSQDNSVISENKTGITAESYDNMKANAANAGITFNLTNTNLDIFIDQKQLFPVIPSLVADDVITKIDASDIKNSPMSVTVYAIGITYSVNIMSGVYAKNPQLDNLHVTAYVLPASGGEKGECYRFDYTRDRYNKLNMNTTNSNDFIANTPGFTFTSWCKSTLEYENKA